MEDNSISIIDRFQSYFLALAYFDDVSILLRC